MGLDMYLYRMPRHNNLSVRQIIATGEFISWKRDERAQGHTFEDWTGCSEDELPSEEDIKYLSQFYGEKFYAWDEDHKYPTNDIREFVGYWRKANAIHKWFVENVQDGEDDCDYHDEVTKELLEDLRDTCANVLNNAVMVNGKVKNGYHITENGEEPIWEDGKYVVNSDVCHEYLPTTSGFFFGSTDYDEWYIRDVQYTYEICCKLLAETDFDNQMIYYRSSW